MHIFIAYAYILAPILAKIFLSLNIYSLIKTGKSVFNQ